MRYQNLIVKPFPRELHLALKGLSNQKRQIILNVLKDKDKLSFSEILSLSNIESSLLANHLKILEETLLLDQFYEHEINIDKYSYYQLTDFGQRLMSSLEGSLYMHQKIIKKRSYSETTEIELDTVSGEKLISIDEKSYQSVETSNQSGYLTKPIVMGDDKNK